MQGTGHVSINSFVNGRTALKGMECHQYVTITDNGVLFDGKIIARQTGIDHGDYKLCYGCLSSATTTVVCCSYLVITHYYQQGKKENSRIAQEIEKIPKISVFKQSYIIKGVGILKF